MTRPIVLLALAACFDDGGDTAPVDDSGVTTPFACGELSCAEDQYCEVAIGGQPDTAGNADISHACVEPPAECGGTPTCACIDCPGGDCTEDGGVTCTIALP